MRCITYWTSALALAFAMQASVSAQTIEAKEQRRYAAPEARQGVAVSKDRFYAIGNRRIAAYDRETGKLLARWSGNPRRFVHLNSCVVSGSELVCAHSNYPSIPMESSIEWFDARTLRHLRSRPMEKGIGSLTWVVPHEGSWWAAFANYDGKGGEPGRDHRATTLVRYDAAFNKNHSWRFPAKVLAQFAPYSTSGGAWGSDGLLYVTGHDRPVVYVLALQQDGSVLRSVATITVSTAGQAIAWDHWQERSIWSIDRTSSEVVVSKVPLVSPPE